ncbi:hypothetical protein F4703DRAFT_1934355 [Phycomyces blakesleeanus]
MSNDNDMEIDFEDNVDTKNQVEAKDLPLFDADSLFDSESEDESVIEATILDISDDGSDDVREHFSSSNMPVDSTHAFIASFAAFFISKYASFRLPLSINGVNSMISLSDMTRGVQQFVACGNCIKVYEESDIVPECCNFERLSAIAYASAMQINEQIEDENNRLQKEGDHRLIRLCEAEPLDIRLLENKERVHFCDNTRSHFSLPTMTALVILLCQMVYPARLNELAMVFGKDKDGTFHKTARPEGFQQIVFSGHHRHYGLRYQAVMTLDGITSSFYGPTVEARVTLAIVCMETEHTQTPSISSAHLVGFHETPTRDL